MSGRSGIYALSPKVGYTTIYAGVFIARRSTASIGAIDAVYGLRVAAEASANLEDLAGDLHRILDHAIPAHD